MFFAAGVDGADEQHLMAGWPRDRGRRLYLAARAGHRGDVP